MVKGLKVVLTGPAHDDIGNPVLRAVLVKACQERGLIVQPHFCRDTDLLVASRVDTVKARKAALTGLPVLDYPTFIQTYQLSPGPSTGLPADPYVDTHKVSPPDRWVDKL